MKGRGLVAARPFVAGEFVVEYAGVLIDAQRAKNKELMYAKDSEIGSFMYYFEYQGKKLWCVLIRNYIFGKYLLIIY